MRIVIEIINLVNIYYLKITNRKYIIICDINNLNKN